MLIKSTETSLLHGCPQLSFLWHWKVQCFCRTLWHLWLSTASQLPLHGDWLHEFTLMLDLAENFIPNAKAVRSNLLRKGLGLNSHYRVCNCFPQKEPHRTKKALVFTYSNHVRNVLYDGSTKTLATQLPSLFLPPCIGVCATFRISGRHHLCSRDTNKTIIVTTRPN